MESKHDFLTEALSDGDLCGVCTKQIIACGSLDFFPRESSQMRVLITALHQASVDHAHASEIIKRWLQSSITAPRVADIYRIAAESRPVVPLPPGCEICKGEPFIVADSGGAKRCSCARGKAYGKLTVMMERKSA